jgi:hypothetical protein
MKNQIKTMMVVLSVIMLTLPTKAELGVSYASIAKDSKKSKSKASGDAASEKGDFVIQADFNLGAIYSGYGLVGYGGFTPGFTANLDYNVHQYAGVGAYAGMNFNKNFFMIGVGARGVFHWWQLLDDKVDADLKADKIDFYLPLHLGVKMWKWRDDYFDDKMSVKFNGGTGLGFRYYFTPKIGMNLEWGWQELSWAKIGVQFKL